MFKFFVSIALISILTSTAFAQVPGFRKGSPDIEEINPGPVPVLPSVVKQVKKDRIDCAVKAQENTSSTPTTFVLFDIGIDRNLGGETGEGLISNIYRGLLARSNQKPEWRKPAEAEEFTAAYKSCMREKGYAQN